MEGIKLVGLCTHCLLSTIVPNHKKRTCTSFGLQVYSVKVVCQSWCLPFHRVYLLTLTRYSKRRRFLSVWCTNHVISSFIFSVSACNVRTANTVITTTGVRVTFYFRFVSCVTIWNDALSILCFRMYWHQWKPRDQLLLSYIYVVQQDAQCGLNE